MTFFDEKIWPLFESEGAGAKGRLFEKLAQGLLERIYPGEWKPTPISHDHGRDFVFHAGEREHWAECKMHRSPVALTTIGNTLVMALIESINRLVLVSRSKLSKDCSIQVGRFARRAKCTVDVIAGPDLEDLLLGHGDLLEAVLQVELGPLPPPRTSPAPEIEFHVDLAPDLIRLVGDCDCEIGSSLDRPLLHPGSDFVIGVHIHNPADIGQQVRIRVTPPPDPAFTLLADKAEYDGVVERTVRVGARQFAMELFRFSVLPWPGKTSLPHVEVFGADDALYAQMPVHDVEIGAVQQISTLIGAAAAQLDELVAFCRQKGGPGCLVVEGRSGVGKSRFLADAAKRLWLEGFDLLRIDLESLTDRVADDALLIKHILAQLHALPLLEPGLGKVRPWQSPDIADAISDKEWVEEFLYGEGVLAEDATERCVQIIVKGLARNRTAFLIDNAQQVTSLEASIFQEIARISANGKGEAALILAFNLDKIFGDSPGGRLLEFSLDRCNRAPRQWKRFSIRDFTEADVRTFLNAALRPQGERFAQFSESFPETTKAIQDACAPRPLFLWHLLLALHEDGILAREGGGFVPHRAREFADAVQRLPTQTQELLEYRWKRVSGADGVEMIRTLVALFFSAPSVLLSDLGVSNDDLLSLERAGFVRRQDGHILPTHQEIFRFFEGVALDRERARSISDALLRRNAVGSHFIQYFLCLDVLGKIPSEVFKDSLVRMERGIKLADVRGDAFLDRLIHILYDAGEETAEPEHRLHLLGKAIGDLSGITSYSRLTPALTLCLRHAMEREAEYVAWGEAYFQFVHRIVNIHFARNAYQQPFDLMRAVLENAKSFSFDDEGLRDLRTGALLNRLGVAAMWVGRREEAEGYAKEALAIGEHLLASSSAHNDQDHARQLCIEAQIDLGNIYDIFAEGQEAVMLDHWRKAESLFEELPAISQLRRDLAPMVWFYAARVRMAECLFDDARKLLDRAISHSRDSRNSYHGIRNTVLLAILNILEAEGSMPGTGMDVRRLLNQALDWTISSGVAHAEWGILLLRAELAALHGDWPLAAGICVDSLDAFSVTSPDSAMIRLRGPYLAAAMCVMRAGEIVGPTTQTEARHIEKGNRILDDLTASWGADIRMALRDCATLDEVEAFRRKHVWAVSYLFDGYPLLSQ